MADYRPDTDTDTDTADVQEGTEAGKAPGKPEEVKVANPKDDGLEAALLVEVPKNPNLKGFDNDYHHEKYLDGYVYRNTRINSLRKSATIQDDVDPLLEELLNLNDHNRRLQYYKALQELNDYLEQKENKEVVGHGTETGPGSEIRQLKLFQDTMARDESQSLDFIDSKDFIHAAVMIYRAIERTNLAKIINQDAYEDTEEGKLKKAQDTKSYDRNNDLGFKAAQNVSQTYFGKRLGAAGQVLFGLAGLTASVIVGMLSLGVMSPVSAVVAYSCLCMMGAGLAAGGYAGYNMLKEVKESEMSKKKKVGVVSAVVAPAVVTAAGAGALAAKVPQLGVTASNVSQAVMGAGVKSAVTAGAGVFGTMSGVAATFFASALAVVGGVHDWRKSPIGTKFKNTGKGGLTLFAPPDYVVPEEPKPVADKGSVNAEPKPTETAPRVSRTSTRTIG